MSGARVEGERVGCTRIRFTPGAVRPGAYAFEVGTAGAVSAVVKNREKTSEYKKDVMKTFKGGSKPFFLDN